MDKKQIKMDLEKIPGLGNVHFIDKSDIKFISKSEEKRNIGVFECLKREHILVITHDSSFRKPESDVVKNIGNKILFPAVPFSEISAKNAVSSSPSKVVHDYLAKKYNLKLKDDATLIIGFDL